MTTTVNEYEQQALDFLGKTKTTFTAVFKEFNSIPWDKKERKRNIFNITLQNKR